MKREDAAIGPGGNDYGAVDTEKRLRELKDRLRPSALDQIRAKVAEVRGRHHYVEPIGHDGASCCGYCSIQDFLTPFPCETRRWAEAALKMAEALEKYQQVPIDDEWLASDTLAEIAEGLP